MKTFINNLIIKLFLRRTKNTRRHIYRQRILKFKIQL